VAERKRKLLSSQSPRSTDDDNSRRGTWVAAEWMFWRDALVHVANISRSPRLCHAELKTRIDAGDVGAVDRYVAAGADQQAQTIRLDLEFLRRATKHWAAAWQASDIIAAGRRRRNEPNPPDYGSDPWFNGFDPAVFTEPGRHHVFLARDDVLKLWPNEPAPAGALNVSDVSLPTPSRRGPKGYDWVWEVLQAKFYLFLDFNDETAYANIDASDYAKELTTWAQNHPSIGEKNTPDEGTIRKKIGQWMRLWPLLKASNK
jgi:hypothetical protein